jgi:hypothetical protein
MISWHHQENQEPSRKRLKTEKKNMWLPNERNDLAKHPYITDAIKDHNLDFVAIMKSGKQDMQRTNLNRLSREADFSWHCLLPRGRSGGILLGVNATFLQISMIVEGDFFIKFHLCNKFNNFK